MSFTHPSKEVRTTRRGPSPEPREAVTRMTTRPADAGRTGKRLFTCTWGEAPGPTLSPEQQGSATAFPRGQAAQDGRRARERGLLGARPPCPPHVLWASPRAARPGPY